MEEEKMDLEQARSAFSDLLDKVDEADRANFLIWIQRVWFIASCSGDRPAIARKTLHDIAQDIKKAENLPDNTIYASERLFPPNPHPKATLLHSFRLRLVRLLTPKHSLLLKNADSDRQENVHVDAFLYDEMDVEELVSQGKLSRNYCRDCQSRNVSPLAFFSHSSSINRIEFVFRSLLPYQEGTTIVDVGSRLGAMLYGAYVYTERTRIVGVEMNSDLCRLQSEMIEKHGMADRIEVVCADICERPDLVSSADVVIMHNSFELFLPLEEQAKAWEFLKSNIKKGAILVTIPSLESIWQRLQVEIKLDSWVKKRSVTDPLDALYVQDHDELADVCSYQVR